MTGMTADERLANAIWRVIFNPRKIYTKSQIQTALRADGISRTQNALFNTGVRRLLEDKADKKGLAVIIQWGCCFTTTDEWQILHKKVGRLRYLMTLAQSIGHEGTGNEILLAAADPVTRNMGRQAVAAGVFGDGLRRELEAGERVLATTFKAGRKAANEAFAKARARSL